ncbi:S41 family peptidase [Peptostreptococcaceae bacterium oral taxon 929]|uniref:S41 family peptidase n=1 Tax=Fenollaria massiliensis TaxID=938288 RepID=A0A9E7DI02_9FIRM|nr:S41 family peptidase [Fenollaria massiliensis]AVM66460.1 S41 family peptidase [Peptostreptococcaceae bacterium oral taxon 929]UQK58473.1 S41 family peptidase [Fenollaria massiliensis]
MKLKKILITILVLALFLTSNVISYNLGNSSKKLADKKIIAKKDDNEKSSKKINDEYVLERINEVKRMIDKNYYKKADDYDVLIGMLKGAVNSLKDPYSYYMTEDEYKKFNEETDGEFAGLGIYVSGSIDDNLITVVAPMKGTPADRAGLKTDDKIIKINGKDFTADKMDDAVKIMRGKPGEKVKITVLRRDENGKAKFIDFEIVREIIKVQTVSSKLLKDNIGYISISGFDTPTYNDFDKQYKELKKQGMKKLILDLRNNPGGLLTTSTQVVNTFLDGGLIMYTLDKQNNKETINATKGADDIKIVVLVNKGSASASEIVAGALKDRKRATIIGTQTFGKGIVQTVFNMPDGEGLKLTTSAYYTPSGVNIHGKGIAPDIKVELNKEVKTISIDNLAKDNQIQKAIEILNK